MSTQREYEEGMLKNDLKFYKIVNITLLITHILLSIPYMILNPSFMMKLNFVSIAFYIIAYFYLKNNEEHVLAYVRAILVEILLHVIFAVLVLGWEAGFQFWLLTLLCGFLYPAVVPGRVRKKRNIFSVFVLLTTLFEFIGLYLLTKYYNIELAQIPSRRWTTILMIINSSFAFLAIGAFATIFTNQLEYKYMILHRQADFDQLTGLGNRYFMNDILRKEEKKMADNAKYAVAMIDIDDFKKVNDTYGHDNGDKVLCEIAKILNETGSQNIKVGRWGGEEFLLIGTHEVNYNDFISYIEEARRKVEKHPFVIDETYINCTISAGVAQYKKDLGMQEVIKQADNNLYAAKEAGKNSLIA